MDVQHDEHAQDYYLRQFVKAEQEMEADKQKFLRLLPTNEGARWRYLLHLALELKVEPKLDDDDWWVWDFRLTYENVSVKLYLGHSGTIVEIH
jgi:hypothetical protein